MTINFIIYLSIKDLKLKNLFHTLQETIDLSEEEVAAGGQKNLFAFASDVTLEKNLRA